MSLYYIDDQAASLEDCVFDIERSDPSLNGEMADSLLHEFRMNTREFNRVFLSRYEIDYIGKYFASKKLELRVLTHPRKTNTCFEKAELLGSWDPLNVIKALFFEYSLDDSLYAVVVPETGCFIDRTKLKEILGLPGHGFLKKASRLPGNMSFGTCSPFITADDLKIGGGRVEKILFDSETLAVKSSDMTLDDFSFGLDHRMSIQMNYTDCFHMLRERYPDNIEEEQILTLSFKGKLQRANGKINISYEFNSLNCRTAKFINGMHGYGDVCIFNDYIDELDLPSVLIGTKNGSLNNDNKTGSDISEETRKV
jgi:hypothetical protein